MAVTPFNSVQDLCTFTAFRAGTGGPNVIGQALTQSVTDGTFATSQLQLSLTLAREEIYARAGQKENDEYDPYRFYQLKQCELWFSLSTLTILFGEKTALKFPESNLSAVGSVSLGAD